MFFGHAEEIEEAAEADHFEGETIDDGVRISRRQIFRFSAAAGAVALLPRTGEARESPGPDPFAPLSFEKVVEQLRPIADTLVTLDQPNEEAYLHSIAALLHRTQPLPELAATYGGRKTNMTALARHRPLIVYQVDMKPGAKIRLHDHHDYNGVILGVSGAVLIRNFEVEASAKKRRKRKGREEFVIRETMRTRVGPGRTSSLSRRRDNIHEVVAGKDGARLIDVFTFFSKDAKSRHLDFDDKPHGKDKQLYRVAYSR